MNVMKEIQIEKVTLNIGAGKPGPELEKSKILLNKISGMKPSETRTKKRIPGWSLRPNLVIGCKVTIRGDKAMEVVKNLLGAKDMMLSKRAFDNSGNFAFGIHEYLDIPSLDYMPDVGMKGLEISVTLKRKGGYRLKRRSLMARKIPQRHSVSKEEAITFAKEKIGLKLTEEEEAEE
ncbi:MAG: 50S ribosomal protein L5 [Nanoarchaeota archaeon]|nr:50S ribosomal protein L5 [Nanoarchaeota archaeon]